MIRILVILIFISFSLFSQKPNDKIKIKKLPTDTIDYFYLNYTKGYHLKKVMGEKYEVQHHCPKKLSFNIGMDSLTLMEYGRPYGNAFKYGDSLMLVEWYQNGNDCIGQNCFIKSQSRRGKLRINKSSNILIMSKYSCGNDKKDEKFLFKVIKFSEYEIILQDLQKNIKLYYHFIKN